MKAFSSFLKLKIFYSMHVYIIYLSIYLYTIFFIHVSVDRHLKWNYHTIQQSYFQAFIWNNWNQDLENSIIWSIDF